jgi:hypothetical protein
MMDQRQTDDVTDNTDTPMIPHSKPASGSASLEIALKEGFSPVKRFLKMLGPASSPELPTMIPPVLEPTALLAHHWGMPRFGLLC